MAATDTAPKKAYRPREIVAVPADLQPEQRVPWWVVNALVFDSRPTVYRAIKAGTFPAPEHHGATVVWRVGDIYDYLATRRAARATPQQAQVARVTQARKANEVSVAARRAKRQQSQEVA